MYIYFVALFLFLFLSSSLPFPVILFTVQKKNSDKIEYRKPITQYILFVLVLLLTIYINILHTKSLNRMLGVEQMVNSVA